MVRIAICGKMASGKTTMAEWLEINHDYVKFSLAGAVKDFGNFLFDIPNGQKDRIAYQKVGDGARRYLCEDVWINTLFRKVEEHCGTPYATHNIVVDDVRYENEVHKLKRDGWVLIKINIDDELQLQRLKKTYPKDWKTHAEARTHPSEAEVDGIDESLFDFIIEAQGGRTEEIIESIFEDAVLELAEDEKFSINITNLSTIRNYNKS
tara:strand:+ start:9084 stop:9707 length:624 start_codon:yes stop_codon:yes gene_type:complete